jgi:two-component system nitrate/nitrite response regulator NarL
MGIPASCNALWVIACNPDYVPISCLIVDDSDSFLDAARVVLEREGLRVVGVASTGAEAASRAEELRPDVVLVDIALGDESGFEVARRLVDGGGPKVILISTRSEADFADLIAESPAAGFVPKSELSAGTIQRILA